MCLASRIPNFDELNPINGMPQGCAWGVFDREGQKDKLGTLNLLTPDVVQDGAAEIKEGVSISLNWPIDALKAPGFFRKGLSRYVISLDDPNSGTHFGFDDDVAFNTQCSSQWDSLCHFQHIPTGMAYNRIKPTVTALSDATKSKDAAAELPTLHHWHTHGCLAGRGVLIDFKSYAEAKGISYSPFSGFRINVKDVENVAKYQGITFKPSDILIIRWGYTEELGEMNGDEQWQAMNHHRACEVEGTKEMAKWLWDCHFAAVASDTLAFEAMWPMIDGEKRPFELALHQWFLSLFGLPIGELWDLNALAEHSKKTRRYSFFLISAPLNVPGAIGNPPNALAIM